METVQLSPEHQSAAQAQHAVLTWLANEKATLEASFRHVAEQEAKAKAQLEAFITTHYPAVDFKAADWHLDLDKGELTRATTPSN